MKIKIGWIGSLVVVSGGCDMGAKQTVVPAVSSRQDALPQVVHPEFENWGRFNEQATVVRKRTVSNSNGSVLVTTKMWLEKKNSTGVWVGSKVTVERGNEPMVENDQDIVNYPAHFKLPAGLDEAFFRLPSPKAKAIGNETIRVGSQEFPTQVYEWTESNETGPMTVKLWQCMDVPGKLVKQEMFVPSSKTQTTEELVEIKL
jgi:hypothetical protein